jgi:hypothetical protein
MTLRRTAATLPTRVSGTDERHEETTMRTMPRIATTLCALLLAGVSAATLNAQATEQTGGSPDGIKVHGHWTIDVVEADGTPVSHHDFTNALVVGSGGTMPGNALIAGLLGRKWTQVGEWMVNLNGDNGPCSSATQVHNPSACVIAEASRSSQNFPGANVFRNLVLDAPTRATTFPAIGTWQIPTGELKLTGQATAAAAGSISTVSTSILLCQFDLGGSCFLGSSAFSGHTLATPIAVSAGQIVQVSVSFSFS